MQTDNYGRIVDDINSSDLIRGMESVCKNVTQLPAELANVVDKLNTISQSNNDNSKNFINKIKDLIPLFGNKNNKETEDLVNQVKDLILLLKSKKETNPKDLTAKDLNDSLKKNTNFDASLAKGMKNLIKEATTGHSIHTHDFTVVSLLTIISKDIKHIGMMLANKIPDALTDAQEQLVGSFQSAIPKVKKSSLDSFSGEYSRRDNIDKIAKRLALGRSQNTISEIITPEERRSLEQDMRQVGILPNSHEIKKNAHEVKENLHANESKPKQFDSNSAANKKDIENDIISSMIRTMKGHHKHFGLVESEAQILAQEIIAGKDKKGDPLLSQKQLKSITIAIKDMNGMQLVHRLALENAVKAVHKAMDDNNEEAIKATQENLANLSKKLIEKEEKREKTQYLEQRAKDIQDTLIRYTKWMQVSKVGLGTDFDMYTRMGEIREETGSWIRDIHSNLAQNQGLTGTLLPGGISGFRQANPEYKGFLETGNQLAANFNETGERSVAKIQQVLLRNLGRGVTLQSRWRDLSKQGLQLGRMIGVEAEHTSEELTDWHLQMGFTVAQTGQLSRDMLAVSKITGLTGDKLLEAAKSGRQLAEAMRSAGTLTGEAARNMMQLSAAASRSGSTGVMQPLVEAMTDVNQLFSGDQGRLSFLMRAAQAGGGNDLMQRLQQGTIMQDRTAMRSMAEGIQQTLLQITGGRRVEQLDPQSRMVMNLISNRYGFRGINDMQRASDTMRESSMDITDRIADLRNQLGGNLTSGERANINTQMNQLEFLRTGETMNTAMRNLSELTRPNPTVTMTPEQIRGNIQQAIDGITTAADRLTGPESQEQKNELLRRAQEFSNQLNGASNNPQALTDLVTQMDELIGRQQIWERMYQMDQSTFQRENQERHQRAVFEQFIRSSLTHIVAWSPAQASLANTYLGVFRLIETLGLIYVGMKGFQIALALLTSGNGNLSGGLFGGGSGAAGAASTAGRSALTTALLNIARTAAVGAGAYGTYRSNPMEQESIFTDIQRMMGAEPLEKDSFGREYANNASTAASAGLVGLGLFGPLGAAIGLTVGAFVPLIQVSMALRKEQEKAVAITDKLIAANQNAVDRLNNPNYRGALRQELEDEGIVGNTNRIQSMQIDLANRQRQQNFLENHYALVRTSGRDQRNWGEHIINVDPTTIGMTNLQNEETRRQFSSMYSALTAQFTEQQRQAFANQISTVTNANSSAEEFSQAFSNRDFRNLINDTQTRFFGNIITNQGGGNYDRARSEVESANNRLQAELRAVREMTTTFFAREALTSNPNVPSNLNNPQTIQILSELFKHHEAARLSPNQNDQNHPDLTNWWTGRSNAMSQTGLPQETINQIMWQMSRRNQGITPSAIPLNPNAVVVPPIPNATPLVPPTPGGTLPVTNRTTPVVPTPAAPTTPSSSGGWMSYIENLLGAGVPLPGTTGLPNPGAMTPNLPLQGMPLGNVRSHTWDFNQLPSNTRNQIAAAIGATTDDIINHLSTDALNAKLMKLQTNDASIINFRNSLQRHIPASQRNLHRQMTDLFTGADDLMNHVAGRLGIAGDRAAEELLLRPTQELISQLEDMEKNDLSFSGQQGASARNKLRQIRERLQGALNPTSPTPSRPSSPATPTNSNSPTGNRNTSQSGNRDPNFWWNVNRVEDMIWQYVPNLDMIRTNQIAIEAWEEISRRNANGQISSTSIRDIIKDKLAKAGIAMPDSPATRTPFGEIVVDRNGVTISETPGWSGAVQTGGNLTNNNTPNSNNAGIGPVRPRTAPTGNTQNSVEAQVGSGVSSRSANTPSNDFSIFGLTFADVMNQANKVTRKDLESWLPKPNVNVPSNKMGDAVPVTDAEQKAETLRPAGLENYEQSKYYQDVESVEITGPLNTAVDHLDEIENNTRKTADETQQVKELMKDLLKTMSNPPATSGASHTVAKSKPNYWSWSDDLSSNPNFGGRK